MPVPRGWIACVWRAQSTPFLCRFRPESGRWNPNVPLCRLGGALYAVLRRSRLCPQTSSHDRFALATRGFRCAPFVPLACDFRCQTALHLPSRSVVRFVFFRDRLDEGPSYVAHHFPRLASLQGYVRYSRASSGSPEVEIPQCPGPGRAEEGNL